MFYINGQAHDHSSANICASGLYLQTVKDMTYSHGRDGGELQYGTSLMPQGQTTGLYKVGDISMTIAIHEWQLLRTRLGVVGYMQKRFNIIVGRILVGSASLDTIVSARLKNVDTSSSEGGSAAMKKLSMEAMYILEDFAPPMLGLPPLPAIL